MPPALDQHIIYQAYRRGILTGRLPMLRQFYQEKRTVMQEQLRAQLGDLITWPEPKGGFFLWATLPPHCSTDEMLPRAIEQRVIYVAGSAFFVDGSGANILRLSFSLPSKEKIVEGVQRLTRVVREELAGRPQGTGRRSESPGRDRAYRRSRRQRVDARAAGALRSTRSAGHEQLRPRVPGHDEQPAGLPSVGARGYRGGAAGSPASFAEPAAFPSTAEKAATSGRHARARAAGAPRGTGPPVGW